MKNIVIAVFLLAGVCCSSSGADRKDDVLKGSGRIVTETRDSRGFNSVKVSGAVTSVCMTDKTDGMIVVRADDNVMPYVRTIFDGNELIVKIDGLCRSFCDVSVYVDIPYVKNVRRLDVGGSARFSTSLPVKSYELEVETSGAASVLLAGVEVSKFECDLSGASKLEVSELNARECSVDLSGASHAVLSRLDVRKCKMEMSGASGIDVAGACESCDLDVSGTSKFNALGFSVRNCKVDISGCSHANVKCIETISGHVSGVSWLQCVGKPRHRNVSVSRTAKVRY